MIVTTTIAPAPATGHRLHALDAVRGLALLAGVVLHATMSFLPGLGAAGWPIADLSTSRSLAVLFFVIHMGRMTTFFLLSGFLGRLLLQREGIWSFVRNRGRRILLPLVVGWIILYPTTVALMIWGGAHSQRGRFRLGPHPFSLLHLWFLYLLVGMYAAVLLAHWCFESRLDPDGRLRARVDTWILAIASRSWAPVVFAAPLCVALYCHPRWYSWFGIPTPRGLVPSAATLIGYGTAFVLGWLLHRQRDPLPVLERQWGLHLASAVAFTVASVVLIGATPTFTVAAAGPRTLLYAACYSLATWNWTFGVIGFSLKFFATASPLRRYLADASYWIYLVHLPVVMLLQALLQNDPRHWTIKFPLVLGVALTLTFASYHYLVRFTALGVVLNGRRHVRRTASGSNSPVTVPHANG
ncbi:MAG: acyltransferase family protein [Acidobacteriota bacterium]